MRIVCTGRQCIGLSFHAEGIRVLIQYLSQKFPDLGVGIDESIAALTGASRSRIASSHAYTIQRSLRCIPEPEIVIECGYQEKSVLVAKSSDWKLEGGKS